MKKIFFICFCCVVSSQLMYAQYTRNSNGNVLNKHGAEPTSTRYKRIYLDSSRAAICVALQGSAQIPYGNLFNRYGFSKAVGMSVYYKAKSNYCIGITADYFFGNNAKEADLLFKNISTSDGSIIMESGDYAEIRLYERGYYVGPTFGYISNKLLSSNKNTGLSFWLTCGYIEHKTKILGDNVLQLTESYKTGYDRLTAGFFMQEGVFYNHMSINHLINYRVGIELLQGFTKGLRKVNFDTGESGTKNRFDGLMSVKFGWFLPVNMRSKKEEFTF